MKKIAGMFSKKEWMLWLGSVTAVAVSNYFAGEIDLLKLAAALIGVTSLILEAKGLVLSQFLMIAFSILYAVISYQFRYWGEMATYLLMTLPMAAWSAVTWLRNPSQEDKHVVAIGRLTGKSVFWTVVAGAVVTAGFWYLLWRLDTPNLWVSTLSVATSFLAAAFTVLRSPYYAVGYALNDLVLVVMWMLASAVNPVYLPVAVNFAVFFFNDMYGFISWKRRERLQAGQVPA